MFWCIWALALTARAAHLSRCADECLDFRLAPVSLLQSGQVTSAKMDVDSLPGKKARRDNETYTMERQATWQAALAARLAFPVVAARARSHKSQPAVVQKGIFDACAVLILVTAVFVAALCLVRCLAGLTLVASETQQPGDTSKSTSSRSPALVAGQCAQEAADKFLVHTPGQSPIRCDTPSAASACSSSKNPAAAQTRRGCLVPQLVVPAQQEKRLFLPWRPLAEGSLDIVDADGGVVMRARLHPEATKPICRRYYTWHSGDATPPMTKGEEQLTPFVLSSAAGQDLAQCRCRDATGQDFEFLILDFAGSHYAKLKRCEQDKSYVIETISQGSYYLSGCFLERRIKIVDEEGRHVAETEPVPGDLSPMSSGGSSGGYQVQGSPGADLGLIICALLCISHCAQKPRMQALRKLAEACREQAVKANSSGPPPQRLER